MRPRLMIAWALACLAAAGTSNAQDSRFRTYGASEIGGYEFPFRNGGTSAEMCAAGQCTGDFVTVGQLNDRSWGPYAGRDTETIFKRWFFLRQDRPSRRWDCSVGLDFSVTNWITTTRCIDQMGSDKYEEIVRNILGVAGGKEYKRDVLNQQLAAEVPHLPEIIANHGDLRPSEPLVFEVGNEPNVFPAMSPALYAWYYTRWVDEIRAAAAGVNADRSLPVDVKVMPAGLWISEGEPDVVRNVLNQGVAVAFGRITIRVPDRIGWCGSFPFKYPCVKFRSVDLTPGVDVKGRFYMDTRAYLDQFLQAVPAGYVDYGNLHFYPYIGGDSPFGVGRMPAHIDLLRRLAEAYASRATSGEVWLTEIGNFNPTSQERTITEVMVPMLEALKAGQVPQVTRWYWFKAKGEDKKFSMLPRAAKSPHFGLALVLGDQFLSGFDRLLGPLFTVVRPVTDAQSLLQIGDFLGRYVSSPPLQGLRDRDTDGGAVRPMGQAYLDLTWAPGAWQWTAWVDRDDPSGNGDGEHLGAMLQEGYPVCPNPTAVQCRRVGDGLDWRQTGERATCATSGLVCLNADQPDRECDDYEVRFLCPSAP